MSEGDFLKRTSQILEKALEALEKALALIGAGLIFLLMFLIVGDVFCRYFLNSPIPGAVEMSELALLVIVFLAASYTFSVGGHVSVEMITSRFSHRMRTIATCFTLIVSLVIFGMLMFGGVRFALRLWQLKQTTMVLGIPISPFVFVVPTVVFVLWMRLLVELLLTAFGMRASNDSGLEA